MRQKTTKNYKVQPEEALTKSYSLIQRGKKALITSKSIKSAT